VGDPERTRAQVVLVDFSLHSIAPPVELEPRRLLAERAPSASADAPRQL
jgi:hypothetical protein